MVNEFKDAGAYVFAAGVDEGINGVFNADTTSGTLVITDGPVAPTDARIGGLTIIDVTDDAAAKMRAGKIAEACGWPQEVRRVY